MSKDTINEKEQQSFLQSQVAMSEVLGEIQDAKETKRKPKVSKSVIEKSKIYFEKNRTQKFTNYFLILGFYAMFLVFANIIDDNKLVIYSIATIFLFFASCINMYEKSEYGYVRKLLADTDINTLETVTYYVFDKVPKIRYILFIIAVFILILLPFLTSIMIPGLINISIFLGISLSFIFIVFFEFIFLGYIK